MLRSSMDIRLRIVLESPPAGVDFGVQKGHGALHETIEKQRSTGGDLAFEFSVALKDAGTAGSADLPDRSCRARADWVQSISESSLRSLCA